MDRVTQLIAKLKDRDAEVRRAAAEALWKLKDPLAVPALIAALKDTDAHVRQDAAAALREMKDARAVPALIEALKDTDTYVRQMTARTLGEIASRNPTPVLRSALPTLCRLRKRDPYFQEAIDAIIDKIDVATSGTKDLPLPTVAPPPDASSLPRPSATPAASPDGLPIPSAPAAENDADLQSERNDAMTKGRREWLNHWCSRQEKRH